MLKIPIIHILKTDIFKTQAQPRLVAMLPPHRRRGFSPSPPRCLALRGKEQPWAVGRPVLGPCAVRRERLEEHDATAGVVENGRGKQSLPGPDTAGCPVWKPIGSVG